jgi:uncharacterized protein YjdB
VTWESNANAIASVSSAGMVTGNQVGSAIVTARAVADQTKTATVSVTVSAPLADLVIESLTAGATAPAGGLLLVSAVVRNQGASTQAPFRLGVYFSADATITTTDTFVGSCTFALGLVRA